MVIIMKSRYNEMNLKNIVDGRYNEGVAMSWNH